MLKNIVISLCMLFFPAISLSVESPIKDIPEKESTPYTWIQQAHDQKPFNFIELAANVAHLRANYSQVSLNLLQSEDLPLADRCSLARSFNAHYALAVQSYSSDAAALRKQILANHPRYKLRGLPLLDPNASAEELVLHNTIFMMSVTLAQWRFFENSLRAFKEHPEPNAAAFTNQLLKELFAAVNYAVNDCHDAEQSSRLLGITSEKYYTDELSYTQCMIDCVMLHAKLVLHLDDSEITYSRLIKMSLQQGYSKNELGSYFGICLFDSILSTQIEPIPSLEVTSASPMEVASPSAAQAAYASSVAAASPSAAQAAYASSGQVDFPSAAQAASASSEHVVPMPESVKMEFLKQANDAKILKSVQFQNNNEDLKELMASFSKTNCHLPLLVYDKKQSEFDVTSPLTWKRAKDFSLSNDCLTFREYLKLFQKEIEEEGRLAREEAIIAERARQAEFLPPELLRPQASASPKQPKFVKGGGKKKSRKVGGKQKSGKEPKVKNEKVKEGDALKMSVVPLPSRPSTNTDKLRLEHRAKQQDQLRQQEAKKEEKRKKLEEEKLLERQEIIARADRRMQENGHALSKIKVKFRQEAFQPTMDELELYELIWGPDSKRKHLSWALLCSTLRKFGWSSYNEDGSSQVFVPPAWFGQVIVHAPDELKVTLRRERIMIHQAHDKAQTPMPSYCIGYLHEALGNNLGLSALMVRALKLKIAS